MRSVWSLPAPRRADKAHGKHPTQKPLALLTRIILAATSPGYLIWQILFTGSSTTGIAAISHGRRFIGSDVSPEYPDMSVRRFEDLSEQKKKERNGKSGKKKVHFCFSISSSTSSYPSL